MTGLEHDMRGIDDTVIGNQTVEHRSHFTAFNGHADGPRVQRLDNNQNQVATSCAAIAVIGVPRAVLIEEPLNLSPFLVAQVMALESIMQREHAIGYQAILGKIAAITEVVQETCLVILTNFDITQESERGTCQQCVAKPLEGYFILMGTAGQQADYNQQEIGHQDE